MPSGSRSPSPTAPAIVRISAGVNVRPARLVAVQLAASVAVTNFTSANRFMNRT